jgi:hypothetical protein
MIDIVDVVVVVFCVCAGSKTPIDIKRIRIKGKI